MSRPARRTVAAAFAMVELLVLLAIMLVLTSLVPPYVMAAREISSRQACMNNLSHVARAMESYCGDYRQYFPSWPAWGSGAKPKLDIEAKHAMPVDEGLSRFRYGENVNMQGVDGWNGVSTGLFRTIFAGRPAIGGDPKLGDTENAAHPARPSGHRNMASHGLGYLLAYGYMADAKTLYCPSVEGLMPPDQGIGLHADGSSKAKAATSIEQLQRSGGLDGKSMTRGDWTWLDIWQESAFHGRVVQCDYNYRGVPAHIEEYGVPWADLTYTAPVQRVYVGCPPFKTQKQLGIRALISDAFSQNLFEDDPDSPEGAQVLPGRAQHAHKNGYNVLYGDMHIGWYGDPPRKIMLQPRPAPQRDKLDNEMAAARWQLGRNAIGRWSYNDGLVSLASSVSSSSDIWHLFDNAVGVDLPREDMNVPE